MSRFNNALKWIVFQVNLFMSMIGWAIIALALYIIFVDWGTLDPDFFLGIGVVLLLIGCVVVSFSCIGCLGVRIQEKQVDRFNGKQILTFYEVLLILSLFAELFMLSIALSSVREVNNAFRDVNSYGISTSFTSIEVQISKKFNTFFFGAVSQCATAHYQWFWNLVDNHCDVDQISQALCNRCDDYSVTACYADETTCDASGGSNGPTCPYTICRKGILTYFRDHLQPISYGLVGLTVFIVIMLVLNLLLICYNKRDSVEEILYKAGIISQPMNRYVPLDDNAQHLMRRQDMGHDDESSRPRRGSGGGRSQGRGTVNAREVVNRNRDIEMTLT